MVRDSIMNLMMELITLSFVVPVVLIAVWKMRNRKSLLPVFAGAGIYLLFGVILKSVPDILFLGLVNQNVWLEALYNAVVMSFLPGLGTYFAIRYFLTKYTERETAVSLGLGYACLYCIHHLGFSNIQNYAFAQMINRKQLDDLLESVSSNQAAVEAYQDLAGKLTAMSRMELIMEGVGQLVILLLQAALAVLVFYSVHKAGQIRYLWISIAMQALVLFLPAFYETGLIPELVVLLCMVILTVGVIQLAYRLYQSLPEKGEEADAGSQAAWEFAGKKLSSSHNGDSHE